MVGGAQAVFIELLEFCVFVCVCGSGSHCVALLELGIRPGWPAILTFFFFLMQIIVTKKKFDRRK